MLTPYLGQITAYAFGFVPKGWAACNGQLLLISSNQPLYSLLGTTYGGDGKTTFGLPNLQGASAVGIGNGSIIGQAGGEANHTLSVNEIPPHTHPVVASTTSAAASLTGSVVGNYPAAPTANMYAATSNVQLGTGSSPAGGAAHSNQQPYLALSFCIAHNGIFPSRD
jgi:microcystin-dependent protein